MRYHAGGRRPTQRCPAQAPVSAAAPIFAVQALQAQRAVARGRAVPLVLQCCSALQSLLHLPALEAFWRRLLAPVTSGTGSEATAVLLDVAHACLKVTLVDQACLLHTALH
jgi:hypothetical protein